MRTAAQLTRLLDRYRQIPHEIELLKQRLIGATSIPIRHEDWEDWKAGLARQRNLDVHYPPPRELSPDPAYQQLLDLHDEMEELWLEIIGDVEFAQAEHALMLRIFWSFPSLRRIVQYPNHMVAFYSLLSQEEGVDPQAFYAAHFVHELQWPGTTVLSGYRKFFLDRAFEVWDEEHKQAFAHWTNMPFFPQHGFHALSIEPHLL